MNLRTLLDSRKNSNDWQQQSEQGHQRQTQRTVEVFACLAGIAEDWLGLQRFVRVHRQGTRHGKPYAQWRYYSTSLATTATVRRRHSWALGR